MRNITFRIYLLATTIHFMVIYLWRLFSSEFITCAWYFKCQVYWLLSLDTNSLSNAPRWMNTTTLKKVFYSTNIYIHEASVLVLEISLFLNLEFDIFVVTLTNSLPLGILRGNKTDPKNAKTYLCPFTGSKNVAVCLIQQFFWDFQTHWSLILTRKHRSPWWFFSVLATVQKWITGYFRISKHRFPSLTLCSLHKPQNWEGN